MSQDSLIVRLGNTSTAQARTMTEELDKYLKGLGVTFSQEEVPSQEGVGIRVGGCFVPYEDYRKPVVAGMIHQAASRPRPSVCAGIDGIG